MNDQTDSTKTLELRTLSFHGDEIITFEASGKPHVAMRRIVDNMRIAWAAQHAKLLKQQSKFNCHDIVTVGADGKEREMLCMPVDKLPLWLATINPNKVRDPAIRAKVEDYQAESAIALHDYWTKGAAIKGDRDGIITGIDPKVMNALGGMVRGILAKQLNDTVPALIESRLLADPRRAALDYVSVRQMLDEAKALTKGRNSLNRRFGHDLRRRALIAAQTGASPARKCPHSGVWLYQRDFITSFMQERGATLVASHNATVMGQGVIRFPKERSPKRPVSEPDVAPL